MLRAGVMALVASLSGCAANYTTENSSPIIFAIVAVNEGSALSSDVLTDGAVVADKVPVVMAVRFKNLNIPTTPSVPSAIILERYEVSYRRSDGRGVEGQDVPFRISGNVTLAIDVTKDENSILSLEVVRAQAKLEPPLRNLQGIAPGALGGAFIVTMFADITLHARTISGQAVTAKGSLQIDFADYQAAPAAPTTP
jgi:hypothetical protein